MMTAITQESKVVGCGVYGAGEALRLLNLQTSGSVGTGRRISRQTTMRWLKGYNFSINGETHYSPPLWTPDYVNDDDMVELSFRDLIELRFVKLFRDAGVRLQTIRVCFQRAVDLINNERPFSTKQFETDGRTIFFDITDGVEDDALLDLKKRQMVFRTFVAPSFKDLEFDADTVARWFPLGRSKHSVMIDPAFAFGRPISMDGHVPTEVLALAASIEGSVERAARRYDVTVRAVRNAIEFEEKLAA